MVEGAAPLRRWPGKGDTLAKLESEETSSIRGTQVLRKQRGMQARMSGGEPPGACLAGCSGSSSGPDRGSAITACLVNIRYILSRTDRSTFFLGLATLCGHILVQQTQSPVCDRSQVDVPNWNSMVDVYRLVQ
jgi:hypothetical protein